MLMIINYDYNIIMCSYLSIYDVFNSALLAGAVLLFLWKISDYTLCMEEYKHLFSPFFSAIHEWDGKHDDDSSIGIKDKGSKRKVLWAVALKHCCIPLFM